MNIFQRDLFDIWMRTYQVLTLWVRVDIHFPEYFCHWMEFIVIPRATLFFVGGVGPYLSARDAACIFQATPTAVTYHWLARYIHRSITIEFSRSNSVAREITHTAAQSVA